MKDVAREGGSLGDAFEFNCLLTAGRLSGLELIPEYFLEISYSLFSSESARFSPDCRSSLLSKRRCPRYFLTVHFSDDDTVNGSSTLENWPQRKKRGACHFYDQFCRKLPRPRGLLGLNISARAARRGGE
ncbi:hypothetical protein J6590_036026 [Homalodisca vitripennis]|nr:hypothetical protein J6590_036026 [Homalodisca vitripennis]